MELGAGPRGEGRRPPCAPASAPWPLEGRRRAEGRRADVALGGRMRPSPGPGPGPGPEVHVVIDLEH